MRNFVLRVTGVAAGLSLIVIPLSAPAAEAVPTHDRLSRQISINASAIKTADLTCGKWSKRISEYRKGCRWGVLTTRGYIPILDRGADGPDANTAEARGLNPSAPPAGDTYAAWDYR